MHQAAAATHSHVSNWISHFYTIFYYIFPTQWNKQENFNQLKAILFQPVINFFIWFNNPYVVGVAFAIVSSFFLLFISAILIVCPSINRYRIKFLSSIDSLRNICGKLTIEANTLNARIQLHAYQAKCWLSFSDCLVTDIPFGMYIYLSIIYEYCEGQ